MLKLKPEGEKMEYENCKKFEGIDGPMFRYAKTEGGDKYIYETYAIAVRDVDKTTAEIGLWASVRDTLETLLHETDISDPIILWRRRPSLREWKETEKETEFAISMRCVIVPRGEKFLTEFKTADRPRLASMI